MSIGVRKTGVTQGRGDDLGVAHHPLDKHAPLASFIADPKRAKRTGDLPLAPPGGKRWNNEAAR